MAIDKGHCQTLYRLDNVLSYECYLCFHSYIVAFCLLVFVKGTSDALEVILKRKDAKQK